MSDLLVITPVKDSIETTMQTIEAIYQADGANMHVIFNDFSTPETKVILEKNQLKYGYELVNLENITETPSPNYRLVLQLAQKRALIMNIPLVIIESDVIIKKDTLTNMVKESDKQLNCGMLGAITTDEAGDINFPYLNFKKIRPKFQTHHTALAFVVLYLQSTYLKASHLKNCRRQKIGMMSLYPKNQKN